MDIRKLPYKESSCYLREAFSRRILILDAAMGTALQQMELSADDFGGEALNGCNENLVLSKPSAILTVHRSHLAAGADIVETNTFGATSVVLAEYDLQSQTDAINRAAVRLAREACNDFSTPERPRFVAGAMGPTTKSLSVTGGITFDEMRDSFAEQAFALVDEGADYLLIETALDTLNIKAAYLGCLSAFERLGYRVPIAVSGTIETMGTMLAGQGVDALYASVEHMDLLYVGLNCATGPEFMRDHIRTLAQISCFPVAVAPNAGIPLPDGTYPESPEQLAGVLGEFVRQGWLNMVGGCCGTTAEHIRQLAAVVAGQKPRQLVNRRDSRLSGIDALVLEEDGRPYIVGERTNVIGSRAFKTLITEEKYEEAAEIARKQVKSGAHIIDVCLSNPDRDEVSDMVRFMEKAAKLVKVPFMIDSQVPEVVEAAFKLTQGKCILNSVNLEDGEKSFEELLPVVKQYGAAIVVGCIRGEMAVDAVSKLDVAKESHRLLTEKYGICEEDIIFDPLVFPCGTGDENYFGSGAETIEGVRLIKETFPRCKTVLGISNVSFGLPPAGREVLNSMFVYHCTKAGLDLAIVNSEKMVRYAQITDEEKRLCDDLLWYRTDNGYDPVAAFAAYFRDKKVTETVVDLSTLTVEERLKHNIVQGTKEKLIENLDEALKSYDPLGVINGPLMAGMDVVGKLFNDNELIVAEVLQSAEVMKTAVAHLEQFMAQSDTNVRGTMLLATVKGDVHDIGKNLVEIIFGNNGYKIVDLGIKCPPETLIEAYRQHQPNLIGLSGLLVKSAQQMVVTAQDLKAAGISVPILVGGAALTENFTVQKIAPEYDGMAVYCKDAMSGLSTANALLKNPDMFKQQLDERVEKVSSDTSSKRGETKRVYEKKLVFEYSNLTAKAPHFEPIVIQENIEMIWQYVNPQMLYGNHLGMKGNVKQLLAKNDEKMMKLQAQMEAVKARIVSEKLLSAKAVYQFFKVRRSGNDLIVLHPDSESEWKRFTFPRQPDGLELCLTDFVHPDQIDTVCMFVVTCGDGVAAVARELMDKGEYFASHALSAMALESAEGFAELMHQKIRAQWGIGDPPDIVLEDIFKLKYTGIRVSFGYPACPNLEDQEIMWELLRPEERIGVQLSEECMMHPEASVSAVVFHHPQARYFSVGG